MKLFAQLPAAALAALMVALRVSSSLYDPHVPTKGNFSFFEGWYSRIVPADGNSSFAVIFGLCHIGSGTALAPRALITIAYQDNSDPAASLQAFTDFPAASTITITRNGSPVTSDPDYKTPAHFRWDAGKFGYQETRGNATTMNFTVGGVSFYAETSSITPWTSGTSGFGPAGALDSLPLPLHWFVHSLSASVTAYSFVGGGRTVEGLVGRAHMEKNWGREFPDRWMWAEARDGSDDGVTGGVSFAFSGGDLVLWGDPLTMNTSHLAGYRNSNKHISWDFTPLDSRLNASVDACKGLFSFDLVHNILPHRLSVSALVPVPSLRTCLWGPAQSGFAPMSTESFLATIEITARTRRFDRDEVLDTVVMRHAALEFGGAYRCMQPDPCAQPLE